MSTHTFLKESTTTPDASNMRFGLVVAEWNSHITDVLLDQAVCALLSAGAKKENIIIKRVPGSFELIFGCSELARYKGVDGIIAIGSVIRGDTPHFDYICNGVTQELARQNSTGGIPIIYGLLTTENEHQAIERIDGTVGRKGEEFAMTAIKMIDFSWSLKK